MFECVIDERLQSEEAVPSILGERVAARADSLAMEVIAMRETLTMGLVPFIWKKEFSDMLSFLVYGCEHPSRKKRISMDINRMVNSWLPLIKKLATAHDIDEKDAASSKLDELLLPIIAAPVAQLRMFYKELVRRMKEDKDVPWTVWRLFEFWGENVLDKIDKERVVELKKGIAARIAQNSIEQIPREDWINSMIGALQWRSPEKLQEIEARLQAGEKPRVRGKESCLFLQVGEAEVML